MKMKKENNAFVMSTTMTVVIFIIVGGLAGGYAAKETGYLPWIETPQEMPDVYQCNPTVEICGDELLEKGCAELFSIFKEKLPQNIKSKYFVTYETPQEVMTYYEELLSNQGYRVLNSGTLEVMEGHLTYYTVYIKGITITLVTATGVSAPENKPSTCVFYGVGSLFSIKEFIDSEQLPPIDSEEGFIPGLFQ